MTDSNRRIGVAGKRPRYDSYDVVVVGARVAGAATALLLGRCGYRVLMVDRAEAGADTTSTHTLLRTAVLQLDRWGLLDQVVEAGTPPIKRVTLGFGREIVPIELSHDFGVEALYAPRRTVLDPILVRSAEQAGVEYVDGITVAKTSEDRQGRVIGVIAESGGVPFEIRARFVVGADGVHSRIARAVGTRAYRETRVENLISYGYYRGIETDGVYFQFTPGVTAGLIPTDGDLVCVYLGLPVGRSRMLRPGDELAFVDAVGSAHPRLSETMESAARVGPHRRMPVSTFLRKPFGPGWTLVGDAGYTKDPISAHGISDAFRDAELCARALDSSLQSPGREAEEMAEYHQIRDQLAIPVMEKSSELASYGWDAERASILMRGISGDVKKECDAIVSWPAWEAVPGYRHTAPV